MCITPIIIGKGQDKKLVGCGKCMTCHIKYCNQWAFRLNIHAKHNPHSYCITLTYNNKSLPLVKHKKTNKVYMTLVKAHVQKFFKDLRIKHDNRYGKLYPRISYMLAGEYGDKFKRPHYHLIIFNAHADDIITSWLKGDVYFGNNDTQKTLIYTLKYQMKSRIQKYYHKDVPYIPPFMLCSKGIGKQLLNNVTAENVPHNVKLGNINLQLPKYYADKLKINIDTEKHKEAQIKKYYQFAQTLEAQKLSTSQWRKMYHHHLWKTDKTHMYDNEIILSGLPEEILRHIVTETITNK